jgi:hypothetical protein
VGTAETPEPAILFTGLLIGNISVDRERIYSILERELGSIILRSQAFPFRETDYYAAEMGSDILRVWIGFDRLIGQEELAGLKRKTNGLEERVFSRGGRREVNIDPGYLTMGKVVLASTKNNQHRIYLGGGMYGEVTLRFRKNRYSPWEWTFADYRREEAVRFFRELRSIYRIKLTRSGGRERSAK